MLKLTMILLVLALGAERASACGSNVGEMVPGNKVVGFQLKSKKGIGEPNWAIDDDGLLVLSMAASHCYNEMDREASDDTPLKCVVQVRGIVKKAVSRNAEYAKEQTNPVALSKLSREQTAEILAAAKSDQLHIQKLVTMFNSTPVKIGDFKEWIKGLGEIIKTREYQVVSSPDSKFDPEKQQSLNDILAEVGSPLPFVIKRTRCLSFFPKDLVEVLQNVIWESRGSGPGTQGGQGVKR